MGAKPPKKSDLTKHWMQPRKNKKILIQPEYHLIVSEGTKTEPRYFEGLKREIARACGKQSKERIIIQIEGEGDNTLTLLERAIEHVKKNGNSIHHVWLVYDKDDFPADNFDNTDSKCKCLSKKYELDDNESQSKPIYHALWSNQCIELWFLLHFNFHQEDITRTEYKSKLNTYLMKLGAGKYKKSRNDIYDILRPNLHVAIKNAIKLEKQHKNQPPSKNAPGTKVYEIFEKLSPYLSKNINI